MARLVLLVSILLSGFPSMVVVNAGAVPPADQLFRQVEARFDRLSTLSYAVKRSACSKKQCAEDQWLFRYKKPDQVRVDYRLSYEKVIVSGGTVLTEYIPAGKKALRTDLAAMPEEKRKEILKAAFGRVSVAGLRLGDYEEMVRRAVSVKEVRWGGEDAYRVEGADPRYVVYIHKDRNALLRTEIYDKKGNLVVRTDASNFTEAAGALWLPREIKTTYNSPDGFVQTTVLLRDIRGDEPIPDEVFQFEAPPGVSVVNN